VHYRQKKRKEKKATHPIGRRTTAAATAAAARPFAAMTRGGLGARDIIGCGY